MRHRICALAAAVAAAALPASAAAATDTLHVDMAFRLGSVDPAFAFDSTSWQLEYATCLKLLNYPDEAGTGGTRLQPDAAVRMPLVSPDGRTYTFVIRGGLRFSPPSNELVTAETFVHAIERTLDPAMNSPAAAYVDIEGAGAFHAGTASTISGLDAGGNVLRVTLDRPAPDFLSRIAMPFFCAVPRTAEVDASRSAVLPSAGPYYVERFAQDGSDTVLLPNPNYGGRRPQPWSEIRYHHDVPEATTELRVLAGESDYAATGLPIADYAGIAAAYGPDSGAAAAGDQRFFVNPVPSVFYVPLNTSRTLFDDSTLRRAFATALDRRAMAAAAGAFGGTPTDQILSPGIPGYVDADLFPLGGDPAAAAALAATAGPHPATAELYAGFGPVNDARIEIVRAALGALGVTANVHRFFFEDLVRRLGTRGEPFDLAITGWIADYADPFDVLNILLDGSALRASGNTNYAYFDDAVFNGKLHEAAALTGEERYAAYGVLDAELAAAAPIVPFSVLNSRDFLSERIGCETYQPVYGIDLIALCLR